MKRSDRLQSLQRRIGAVFSVAFSTDTLLTQCVSPKRCNARAAKSSISGGGPKSGGLKDRLIWIALYIIVRLAVEAQQVPAAGLEMSRDLRNSGTLLLLV
jgi:hypothetical protein